MRTTRLNCRVARVYDEQEGYSMSGRASARIMMATLFIYVALGPQRTVAGDASPGRTIIVAPSGKAGAAGTREAPLSRVQEALDRAKAGDTVHLLPGVYRERVAFRNGGTHGRPVVLEGEPGAILDASDPVALKWEPAPDVGPHVYQVALPESVITVTAGGKIITILDEKRVDPEAVRKALEKGKNPGARGVVAENVMDENWPWPKIFQRGIGKLGWTGPKALAMYHKKEKRLLVRFKDDLDPRKLEMTVAPRKPCITITKVDRCVVRGLRIRNGWEGVRIEDSVGSVVEQCVIGPMDFGVSIGSGAKQCTLRFNEIFMNPYAGASPYLEGSWDNWLAHKVGGFYDRVGIDMRKSVGGHEIHDNWIHDQWDGIQDVGDVGTNRELHIHHNRISDVSDDGLEPDGAEEDCRWHDNIVDGSICGFRIKSIRRGPLYAYRNIFLNNKEDYRNFQADQPAEVFVYHNTSTAGSAVTSNKVQGAGTPNYYFLNNLFWCERWWSGGDVEPNWHGQGNVFVRRGTDKRWDTTRQLAQKQKIDGDSIWVDTGAPGFSDFEKKDVRLTEKSPARQKALDPQSVVKRTLPGCEPGYFKGARPDAGALQFGDPMPVLPRAPGTVSVPAAGTWPE
jgi:hypothetical protein